MSSLLSATVVEVSDVTMSRYHNVTLRLSTRSLRKSNKHKGVVERVRALFVGRALGRASALGHHLREDVFDLRRGRSEGSPQRKAPVEPDASMIYV